MRILDHRDRGGAPQREVRALSGFLAPLFRNREQAADLDLHRGFLTRSTQMPRQSSVKCLIQIRYWGVINATALYRCGGFEAPYHCRDRKSTRLNSSHLGIS